MALDLRTKLNGFSIETLRQHLAKIENESVYSYYADVIRAFLSNDAEEVAKYQQDERSQVAIAACDWSFEAEPGLTDRQTWAVEAVAFWQEDTFTQILHRESYPAQEAASTVRPITTS